GDNFTDLAIGLPFADVSGVQDAGAVLIVYGTGVGLVCNNGTAQFRVQGFAGAIKDTPEPGDRFGSALAAGDFNGDGRDDLAVGVPREDINGTDAGAVNVLYGANTGLVVSGNQLFSQAAGSGLAGTAESGDQFGFALAAGDFNNDGKDDLVVGVVGEDLGTFQGIDDAGAVNVIYGSAGGLTSAGDQFFSQETGSIAGGAEDDDRFGHALAAGDFSGDGIDDLAISAVREDIGSINAAGAVHVLFGKPGIGLDDDNNQLWFEGAIGNSFGGPVLGTPQANDQFGFALVAADFNDTGIDDLGIGVPGERVSGQDNAGAVHVLNGAVAGSGPSSFPGGLRTISQQFWTQDGKQDSLGNLAEDIGDQSEANDSFGVALGAGDFTGDGAADLIVGDFQEDVLFRLRNITDAGAINVLYGTRDQGLTASGNQFLHPGGTDAIGNVIDGVPQPFARFGSALTQ
ncbi:MAG: FG-GAP repeat protein, partial [Gammaproteobacteria bacterium]